MAIAATRLHRSLVGLASDTTHVYDEFFTPPHRLAHCCRFSFNSHGILHNNGLPVQGTKQINVPPVQMNRMEVAVSIISEEHGALHTRGDGSSSNIDEQMHGKANGFRSDDDVERGV